MQLSRINEIKAKRRQVAKWYQEMLTEDDRLIVPAEPNGCDISWFVFVVRLAEKFTLEQRNWVLKEMNNSNIQVSNYFPPVHLQPFISARFGYKQGDFPVTESVCKSTIALPFYNNLAKDEVAIVCKRLKETLDKNL